MSVNAVLILLERKALSEDFIFDRRHENRVLLRKFIKLYKHLPELWNSKHPSYMNRMKKNRALDKLLVVFRKIKTDAERGDVKKLLTSIQITVANNGKRCKLSWQFHALSAQKETRELHATLVEEITEPSEIQSSIDEPSPTPSRIDAIPESTSAQCPLTEIVNSPAQSPKSDIVDESSSSKSTIVEIAVSPQHHPAASTSTTNNMQTPTNRPRIAQSTTNQNKLLTTLVQHSAERKRKRTDDEYFVLSRVWASKLRRLEPHQKLLAEQAVQNLLF